MPDVYSSVAELDVATQERLAAVLETRGNDPQQRALRHEFLSGIEFPPRARVLEVGCGTGALTRLIARWPNVAEVIGVDPADSFLREATKLVAGICNVSFQKADGRSLPFKDTEFDVVIFDSTLCHVPEPGRALAEAFRVLRPSGWLAIFDGDYATTTVALGDHDPLQTCVDAMMKNSVNDRWLSRRLPGMVRGYGFELGKFRSHGYLDALNPTYMLTVIDRGADLLLSLDQIGEELAATLKSEARRRIEQHCFFGHIAYVSLLAQKPSA
jgi:SAM-dependent methyltransferase